MNLEIHSDQAHAPAQEIMPPKLEHFCNALSDSVRTRIIGMLMGGSALPASQIASELRMSPQATRFHLRMLEQANLVIIHPCGRHRYYEIAYPIRPNGWKASLELWLCPPISRRKTNLHRTLRKPGVVTTTLPGRLR